MRQSSTHRLAIPALLLSLSLLACTQAGPAAEEPGPIAPAQPTPTAPPSPSPTEEPMVTPEPTAAPAAPTGTPVSQNPDDYYAPGGGAATATPGGSGEATVSIGHSAEHTQMLVGPEGLTLYIFTRDRPGVSNCDESCAAAWPPLTLPMGETPTAGAGVTGTLGTIEREDGSRQVTYNDQPLYYYTADTAPGQTNGQGVGGYWFVVEP